MIVNIDPNAGFCFGVRKAIKLAEEELGRTGHLFCLGQVVHNEEEESRLKKMGLEVIDWEAFKDLKGSTVLIRAHGEPPQTYKIANKNNLTLIDGTCPIVLKLQADIKNSSIKNKGTNGQVVIYGKKDHPEVIGLAGQVGRDVILVEDEPDIQQIDFNKSIYLYAQTTKSKKNFASIIQKIEQQIKISDPVKGINFTTNNSICRHVSGRDESLRLFAQSHDVIIFVGGEHSSNGKQLFGVCKHANERSWYIGGPDMIKHVWFQQANSVGISGATSTPRWLLQDVAGAVEGINLEIC